MKRFLILLIMIFTTDSFASGIASNSASAPCTNNTLETYSGNSNLAADWQPNTINLRWYNNNTLMDVQSSANTCVYDGTLSVPQTAPSRTGYTFAGWQVRPEMDFATLNTTSAPINFYGKDEHNWCRFRRNGNVESYYCTSFPDVPEFNDLGVHEAKIVFEHGTLYIMGKCSAKSGNSAVGLYNNDKSNWTATSAELDISGEQKYFWCKATGYKPNNEDTIYGPSKQLDFIIMSSNTAEQCSWTCAMTCATVIYNNWSISSFRAAVLGLY